MNLFSGDDAGRKSEGSKALPEESFTLPEELTGLYEFRSCLNCTEQSVTCLLRERSTGRLCLMKAAADPVYAGLLKNERDILRFIHDSDSTRIGSAFSYPLYLGEIGGTTYYIRSYIEGSTLEELCEAGYHRPGLEPFQALNYIIALTELLQFLHSLNPPLIHRDIKPQNVIVDPAGTCHFIDLGISRFFHPEKDTDTFIMGTKLTAPPEQFGFRQTDMRSDLYSMGVLLFYCITGEYEIDEQALGAFPEAIQHIVRKATMFDPNSRYQTAGELLEDLLAARYPSVFSRRSGVPARKRTSCRIALVSLLTLCMALTALLVGNHLRKVPEDSSGSAQLFAETESEQYRGEGSDVSRTETAAEDAAAEVYTFRESMIEQAVRAELDKPEGPITTEDLRKITAIHIFGLLIYSDDGELHLRSDSPWFYDDDTREAGLYQQTGPITSLEDIRHMPNLSTLSLYGQQISDISALEGLQISELGLGWNPLTDLSPLRGNETLRSLCLADLDLSNEAVPILGSIPNLISLNISGTKISSLEGMEACDLETLNIYAVPLADYGQLQMFSHLSALETDTISPATVRQLAGLPLRNLFSSFSDIHSLNDLSVLPGLETLRLGGDTTAMTFDEPQLAQLRSLDLDWMVIPDFHGASSMKLLTMLRIYNSDCQSFDGLDEIPCLRTITCTQEQKDAICEQFPDNTYIFYCEVSLFQL